MRRRFWLLGVLVVLPSVAHAQTGVDLLLKPLLSEEELFEARGDALFFNSVSAGHGNDFKMDAFELNGRVREQRTNFIPRVGWDLHLYHFESNIPVLDHDLTDVSVAAGVEIGTVSGYRTAISVGVGYAGNSPFGEGDAWYPKATLLMGKKLDPKTTFGMVLDYDANRPIFPDIPMPGVAYIHEFDPTLSYTAGMPLSSVIWKPRQIENLTIDVTWIFIDTINAHVEYVVVPRWTLYGSFERREEAFHVDEIGGQDRLLFRQHRAELGVRWKATEHMSLLLAGGLAFGGEFSAGWDQRRSVLIADIGDEPYFRFGFERRF